MEERGGWDSGRNGTSISRCEAGLMLQDKKAIVSLGICNLSVCIKRVLPNSSCSS